MRENAEGFPRSPTWNTSYPRCGGPAPNVKTAVSRGDGTPVSHRILSPSTPGRIQPRRDLLGRVAEVA